MRRKKGKEKECSSKSNEAGRSRNCEGNGLLKEKGQIREGVDTTRLTWHTKKNKPKGGIKKQGESY